MREKLKNEEKMKHTMLAYGRLLNVNKVTKEEERTNTNIVVVVVTTRNSPKD